jgi:hypothetical protein
LPPLEEKGKEVKQYMKRIIKVLVVSALMVVLMATTVSPAFATQCNEVNWWKCEDENYGAKRSDEPKECNWWKCGSANETAPNKWA